MKILYRISQLPHQRVFERLMPIAGVEQVIVGPEEKEEDMPNYGYKDFGIQNIITYNTNDELVEIIKKESPDVYIDSVLSFFRRKAVFGAIPSDCKLGYIHHGFCGRASVETFKLHDKVYNRNWMRNAKLFSVACGGIEYFYEWMQELGLSRDKIVLNATPQVDLLCDSNYYGSRKSVVLSHLGLKDNIQTILFFGRVAGPGKEFDQTNEEFFETLFSLHDFVSKHNMLLMIKPKIHPSRLKWFLKTHMPKYYKRIKGKLTDVLSSKNCYMINTERHIYQYFFADVVVLNGASSTELESIIANKPTVTINTSINVYVDDIYGASECAATTTIQNLKDLDVVLSEILSGSKAKLFDECRSKLITKLGLVLDGQSAQRAQKSILKAAGI